MSQKRSLEDGVGQAAAELRARLGETAVKAIDVARWLDGLSEGDRVAAVRGVGRSGQRRLWTLVDGFAALTLRDLVPPDVPALATVRHFGRNTLPAFNVFEKRFTRPSGEDAREPRELHGYNFQSLQRWTGPGYFVAASAPDREEVWVDYRRLPDQHPEGWPEIASNERGIARFVFGHMVDTLRRVSEHVSIGRAARHGRDLDSWFLLCREERPNE
jgi:hypothetical protein